GMARKTLATRNSSTRSNVPKIGTSNAARSETSATLIIIIAIRKTAAARPKNLAASSNALSKRRPLLPEAERVFLVLGGELLHELEDLAGRQLPVVELLDLGFGDLGADLAELGVLG